MAYRENAKILKADCLADGVYEIWFETKDIAKAAKAGQFISVYSNDGSRMLPRPISICKVENNNLRIVFRVAGKGTEEFSKMKAGEYLDIQGPLGNGYDLGKIAAEIKAEGRSFDKAILFGGGIGVPPMLELARRLDCHKNVVVGYRNSQTFLKEDFEAVADTDVYIATEDGSVGAKGNVLDAVKQEKVEADVIFACGPTPMLRAIKAYALENDIPCYVSLEEKMACGIGACLACVCTFRATCRYAPSTNPSHRRHRRGPYGRRAAEPHQHVKRDADRLLFGRARCGVFDRSAGSCHVIRRRCRG